MLPMRPFLASLLWGILLVVQCRAQDALDAIRGFGAEASVIRATCPQHSLYGENFYLGASLLERTTTATLAGCCSLCSDTDGCSKWAYCHMNVEGGCVAPVGPWANTAFEAGTCLLSSSLAADRRTWMTWSLAQPGVAWVSGEVAGNASEANIVETADEAAESIERIKFDTSDEMFCRVVEGGPLQLAPLDAQSSAPGPAVEQGQELRFTGVRLADASGADWAVVFSADSGSLWRYPAADLGYCNGTSPGCAASASGGSTEEGASCAGDDECCGGLVCLPRGTENVWVSWSDANSTGKVVFGGAQHSSGLQLLPNECARVNSEEDVGRFDFGSSDKMFCLTVVGGTLQLSSLDAASTAPGPAIEAGQQLYYTGLRVADGNGSDWAVVFYPASSSLWRYPAADLSPCNGTVPGCDVDSGADLAISCAGDDECCGGQACLPRGPANVWLSWSDVSGSGRALFGSGPDHSLQLLPGACGAESGGGGGGTTGRLQFDAPQWEGVPLSFCLGANQGCGAAAAAQFCAASGYDSVADWSGPVALAASQEFTISVESGELCKSALQQCQTFYYIVCQAEAL